MLNYATISMWSSLLFRTWPDSAIFRTFLPTCIVIVLRYFLLDQFVGRFNIASWSNDFLLKHFLVNYLNAWRSCSTRRRSLLKHIVSIVLLCNWWTGWAHVHSGVRWYNLFLLFCHVLFVENFRGQKAVLQAFKSPIWSLIIWPLSVLFLGTLIDKWAHASTFRIFTTF